MAVIPLSQVLRLQALKLLLSKLFNPLTLTDILTDAVRSQRSMWYGLGHRLVWYGSRREEKGCKEPESVKYVRVRKKTC